MSVTTPSSCTGTASPTLSAHLRTTGAAPFSPCRASKSGRHPAQTPPGAPARQPTPATPPRPALPAAPAPWPATWRAAPAANRPATPASPQRWTFDAQRQQSNRPCQGARILHMPRQSTGAHGIQRVCNTGARQQGLQFVNAAARRFETLATARGEDEDSGWGEMHGVDEECWVWRQVRSWHRCAATAVMRPANCAATSPVSLHPTGDTKAQSRTTPCGGQTYPGLLPAFHGPTVFNPKGRFANGYRRIADWRPQLRQFRPSG